MNIEEIQKQREIGKYLMLVDIILKENERHSGYSFVSCDDLANWASVEKQEINNLLNCCSCFETYHHAFFSANDIKNKIPCIKTDNDNIFLIHTILNNRHIFIHDLIYNEQDDFYTGMANTNYKIYCKFRAESHPVSCDFRKPDLYRLIFINYISYFCSLFNDVLSYGYDWDVVNKIANTTLSRERWDYLLKISSDFTETVK